jgi:hypothetical protein
MIPEQLHRAELKKLGYKDEVIELLVTKYIANCTYEFAEAYHQHKLNQLNADNQMLIKSIKKLVSEGYSTKQHHNNKKYKKALEDVELILIQNSVENDKDC